MNVTSEAYVTFYFENEFIPKNGGRCKRQKNTIFDLLI